VVLVPRDERASGGSGAGGGPGAAGGPGTGGERLAYDKLLIATGARPRHWPGDPIDLDGVFTLRELDDSLALRSAFEQRPRLAIVGAGFIGCEVAATARKRGLDVTLIDIADQPMTALGPAVGARCADMHRAHGVELRLGVGVDGFEGDGRIEAVRLADGTRVEADVAVVALGAIPNTDWLADSGLELQPGVVCDATLAARDAADVFCAGDVAAWPHPMADGGVIRIEHWTNAAEQGAAAARNLLAAPAERTPYEAVPYFWSDQYDVKIQSVGLPARAERMTVLEATPEGDRLVLGGERGGRLVAAIGFNAARRLAFYRGRLAAMPPFDDVVAAVRADEKALGDPAAVVA
jgi:3-phenylpropionate/trans-cinnamate dioxygenase ferredoxin reductase subunit